MKAGQAGAGTKPPSSAAALCALGLALALLALAVATPTGDAETGDDSRLRLEFPRAPQHDGTYRNLDPEFRRASNWTRLRVYLLSLAAMVKGERPFVALPIAVPDLTTLRQNRHRP